MGEAINLVNNFKVGKVIFNCEKNNDLEQELIKVIDKFYDTIIIGDEKMTIINDKNYDNVLKKVSFGEYSVTQDGKKRNGSAPFISFRFDNVLLGLETIYDKKWLKELKISNKTDISKYISDITYEDEKGWISLITGNYNCFINKVENNKFVIEFRCETEECGEYYRILLNEEVKIDFK